MVTRLKEEKLDEVFRWMLRGCVRWYSKRTLDMPQSLKTATNEFIEENDIVQQWLLECTTHGGKGTPKTKLYQSFKDWCGGQQIDQSEIHSNKKFYSLLLQKRYTIGRGGNRVVKGLDLKISQNESAHFY